MKKVHNILVVDDDPTERNSIVELLKHEGYSVESASDGEIASGKLVQGFFDIVITDVKMPGLTGFDLLKQVKQKHPETLVILITGYGQIEDAVTAIKLGAFDYIMKPFDDNTIRALIIQAIEQRVLQKTKLEKQTNVNVDYVIGQDEGMQKIMELIKKVANSNVTVLITGESGTGKSLIAKAIHYNSPRKHKPYIEVSCGAIPDTLLESELFGHAKGSFTGAINEKPGRFEQADGGTIFLDEIDNAKPSFQVKLLRVLQDKKFERLGGLKPITSNVRVIVATNSNLKNEIKKGNFRQDLYYRINVMPINIPSLRERRSDIKLLADHFLYKYSNRNKKKDMRISDETMYKLQKYSWPGNVRELENTIQRAVVTASGACINVSDISSVDDEYVPKLDAIEAVSLKKAMEKPEKEFIERTLKDFNWSKNKTAKVLNLNRTTLYKKMKKYGLLSKSVLKSFLL
jgi:two-component system response regulator AtoC